MKFKIFGLFKRRNIAKPRPRPRSQIGKASRPGLLRDPTNDFIPQTYILSKATHKLN